MHVRFSVWAGSSTAPAEMAYRSRRRLSYGRAPSRGPSNLPPCSSSRTGGAGGPLVEIHDQCAASRSAKDSAPATEESLDQFARWPASLELDVVLRRPGLEPTA